MTEKTAPDNVHGGLGLASRLEVVLNNLELLAGQDDRLREIVAARRDLMVEIGSAAAFFDSDSCPPDRRPEARRRLSDVRHIVSLHQANWPVVLARDNPEAYRRSAQEASRAMRDFIGWLKAQRFQFETRI